MKGWIGMDPFKLTCMCNPPNGHQIWIHQGSRAETMEKCCHIQGDTPCWLHRPSLPHCSLDQASQQGPSHSQNVQVGLKGMRLFCCPNLFFLHVLRNGTGMCRK